MDKQKEIEKIAEIICEAYVPKQKPQELRYADVYRFMPAATALINAGYGDVKQYQEEIEQLRKQLAKVNKRTFGKEKKQAGKIYYVCNREGCTNCSPECNHTSKITHAKNFTPADINGNYPVPPLEAAIFIERIENMSTSAENGVKDVAGKGGRL
ncbi:MAG: hypothetical protein K2N32_04330 [Clostridia bacterium]|nr:hypothetical protein [Clostridia bacterium]